MVVVFFILNNSIAFITFITLKLLSPRVRAIRIQSPDNLRNKGGWWGQILPLDCFVIAMEELAKPIVSGAWLLGFFGF